MKRRFWAAGAHCTSLCVWDGCRLSAETSGWCRTSCRSPPSPTAGLRGYNAVGCRRASMTRDTIHAIRAAYRCIHSHRLTDRAIQDIEFNVENLPEVLEILEFIRTTKRGIVPSVGGRRNAFEEAREGSGNAE